MACLYRDKVSDVTEEQRLPRPRGYPIGGVPDLGNLTEAATGVD